jgi:hypothetical protein
MRTGPEPTRLGLDTCRHRTPAWVLFKARVCSILGPHSGWPGPHTGGGGGPDPIPGGRLVHVEVLDQPWRSRLYIQGSGTLPWGSRLTVETLGYITFSGHVAAPNPAHVVGSGAVVDLELSPEVGASHGLVPHTTPLPRD